MKNLYYCTKKNVYQITKNEDGTVSLYPEAKYAGAIIMQRGSIEEFLSHCIEDERGYEEFMKDRDLIKAEQNKYRAAMRMQGTISEANSARARYISMLEKHGVNPDSPREGGVIEATADNIYILMRYLRSVNISMWRLPRLTQGYTANQYNCDGKIAVTITLDEGIESEGNIYKKLQYGAPSGHLTKYAPIGRI